MVQKRACCASGKHTLPRIGVSSCLLGNNVRYDRGHCRSKFIVEDLGSYVDFHVVCPEVESGMSSPRETMSLHESPGGTRLLGNHTGNDYTEQLDKAVQRLVADPRMLGIHGFVVKAKSPSCGLNRATFTDARGVTKRSSAGLFTQALKAAYPHMPIETEGRLNDANLRYDFLTRVFAQSRLQQVENNLSAASLIEYHTQNKTLIRSHHEMLYRELGRLIADMTPGVDAVYDEYSKMHAEALSYSSTSRKHHNVLMHLYGYFKKCLSESAKSDLRDVIDKYREGIVPLSVPVMMIRQLSKHFEDLYVEHQTYLQPFPVELSK